MGRNLQVVGVDAALVAQTLVLVEQILGQVVQILALVVAVGVESHREDRIGLEAGVVAVGNRTLLVYYQKILASFSSLALISRPVLLVLSRTRTFGYQTSNRLCEIRTQ